MSTINIKIDDRKRKALKVIASREGKTMGGIVSDLIEDYIVQNKDKIKTFTEKENLTEIMRLSEKSFSEWDNEEDDIYDRL